MQIIVFKQKKYNYYITANVDFSLRTAFPVEKLKDAWFC